MAPKRPKSDFFHGPLAGWLGKPTADIMGRFSCNRSTIWPPRAFMRILDEVGSIAFAGVYDTLSAKLARQAGFPLAFISGYSVAATAIGEPDMGLLTQTEMIERARRDLRQRRHPDHRRRRHGLRQSAERLPHDQGVDRRRGGRLLSGGPGVAEEVRAHAGQAGGRTGRVRRRRFAPPSEARGTADFFIVARTDALAPVGIDEAIARVTAARQAGADASFVEAPPSLEVLAEIGRRAPKPMVANMLEGGKTPVLPQAAACRDGLSIDPLPVDGPLCGRPGDRQFLPEAPRRRHHAGRGASPDDVRRVQRPDWRGREVRPGRAVWGEVKYRVDAKTGPEVPHQPAAWQIIAETTRCSIGTDPHKALSGVPQYAPGG